MSNKEIVNHRKAQQNLRRDQAQKYMAKLQAPLYSQLDSHKWESKMEIFHLLSC